MFVFFRIIKKVEQADARHYEVYDQCKYAFLLDYIFPFPKLTHS
jgi:hypothetical protein